MLSDARREILMQLDRGGSEVAGIPLLPLETGIAPARIASHKSLGSWDLAVLRVKGTFLFSGSRLDAGREERAEKRNVAFSGLCESEA
jgi:hypothetical protein